MSNFNLEKALNGKAFYLQNGYRGIIKYSVADHVASTGYALEFSYVGYILNDKGFLYKALTSWNKNGQSNISPDYHATDMVEETTFTQEKKPMKPFNLEEALQGEPVYLRNGMKGIIYYQVPDKYTFRDGSTAYRPLKGMIFTEEGHLSSSSFEWLISGKVDTDHLNNLDIIGMWEEDISSLIQKALKENLPMKTRDGTKISIVAILDKDNPMANNYPVVTYSGETTSCRYTRDGKFLPDGTSHSLDIVGLWTE